MPNTPVTTGTIPLPASVQNEIWTLATKQSAVAQLATQRPITGNGSETRVVTSRPTAEWVAEGAEKPIDAHGFESKLMKPYKLAVIATFSDELEQDDEALFAAAVADLPSSIAEAFDATVFSGTAPGTGFDVLGGAPTQGISGNSWKGLVEARKKVALASHRANGLALSYEAEALLLGATDDNKRPLFVDSTSQAGLPVIAGLPTHFSEGIYKAGTPNQLGYAGDWRKAFYGTVGGVQVKRLNESTLRMGTKDLVVGTETVQVDNWVSLAQNNLFAVRVEVRVGFVVSDINAFVKLTDATQA